MLDCSRSSLRSEEVAAALSTVRLKAASLSTLTASVRCVLWSTFVQCATPRTRKARTRIASHQARPESATTLSFPSQRWAENLPSVKLCWIPAGRANKSKVSSTHRLRHLSICGVDGLLHITDMAWKRIKHPFSEIANVGGERDRCQGSEVRS